MRKPTILTLLLTYACNLKCPFCGQNDIRKNHDFRGSMSLSLEQVISILDDAAASGIKNVNIWGGEPLLQYEFLIELFKRLKKESIHTCIDTSGMVVINDKIKELIDLTDLFLLDIKHIDPEKCKELVGMTNKRELEFARYLSDNNKHMWIRQVLVPGITDDEQDLLKLKDFINSLKTVDRVEILPYHNMGKYKWDEYHVKYELENVRTATDEDVERAKKILEL